MSKGSYLFHDVALQDAQATEVNPNERTSLTVGITMSMFPYANKNKEQRQFNK